MYGYIYLTENLINGMCYIGKHKSNVNDNNYKGSGTYLKNAFKKYGRYNFVLTIIQWCNSLDELNKAERYWTDKCNAECSPYFYNLIPGGGSTFSVRDMHGENNPMYGSDRSGELAPLYNKICVNDGVKDFYVDKNNTDDAVSKGLHIGGKKRKYSSARSESSKKTVYDKIKKGFSTQGYAWFKNTHTLDNVYIKLSNIEEVNYYTDLGYVRGNLTEQEKLLKEKRGQ